MAHKNSINKPKIKIISNRHAATIGKKRAARSRISTSTRSSTSRYESNTAPRPTDSKAIALYTGEAPRAAGVVTNNTLSNKRAKKIARNQKYVAKRNEKLSIDLLAKKEEQMDIDNQEQQKEEKFKQTKLDKVKEALWAVVEDRASEGFELHTDSEGTTLGVQAF